MKSSDSQNQTFMLPSDCQKDCSQGSRIVSKSANDQHKTNAFQQFSHRHDTPQEANGEIQTSNQRQTTLRLKLPRANSKNKNCEKSTEESCDSKFNTWNDMIDHSKSDWSNHRWTSGLQRPNQLNPVQSSLMTVILSIVYVVSNLESNSLPSTSRNFCFRIRTGQFTAEACLSLIARLYFSIGLLWRVVTMGKLLKSVLFCVGHLADLLTIRLPWEQSLWAVTWQHECLVLAIGALHVAQPSWRSR